MIPRFVKELSSRRVLTMTYVDGYPLADVMGPEVDVELREWVARKIHEFAWRQILEFGVLHTDFHPGNYLVSHHPRLGDARFRLDPPLPRAGAQGEPASRAREFSSGDDKRDRRGDASSWVSSIAVRTRRRWSRSFTSCSSR